MSDNIPKDNNQGTNPYLYALSCISGKWKMSILHHIHHYGFIRFSKTKKTFPISEKVLSQQLKELVSDGLVQRIQFNEIPLRVEYRLTDAGKKVIPALDFIYVWSVDRMRELNMEIDPDAFVVHPEKKYEVAIKSFFDHYEDVCTTLEYADAHDLDTNKILEIIKADQESSI